MKLKHIVFVFTILISVWHFTSCNSDDNTTYTDEVASNDAMIYSFKLKGKMTNAADSVTYPVLEKTVFDINQKFPYPNRGLIYNPDSLVYLTRLTKFLPTISFAPNTASTLEVIYPDSTVTWKSGDSIDFSQSPIEFRVKSPGGQSKLYEVRLNVHKIDPDTIPWENQASWNIPKEGAIGQKLLINGNNLYIYTLLSSGVKVYKSDRNNINWVNSNVIGLPQNIKLESLIAFGNSFYILDEGGNAYKSSVTDAITWTKTNNIDNIFNVLGILPGNTVANDSILVMTKQGAKYYWAKTIDMKSLVRVDAIKGFKSNTIPSDFLANGYSSATNYNRTILSQNLLFVSGGKTFDSQQVADTWAFSRGKQNIMEVTSAKYENTNKTFDVADDFKMFFYDKSLYALTNDSLYLSKWGYSWKKAPKKQTLDSKMKTVKDMSVAVDEYNYIWIVGNMDGGSAYNVWRGRLNRLRK